MQIKQLTRILLICSILLGTISICVGKELPLPESNSKKILFDESHNTYWGSSIANGYSSFASLLRTEGYQVDRSTDDIGFDRLNEYNVLIVAVPFTPPKPFSASEIESIKNFVREGGGLLLIGVGWSWVDYANKNIDTYPANQISKEFGVSFNDDVITDPTDHYPSGGDGNPIFHAPYIIANRVTEGIDKISAGKGNPGSLKIIANSVQALITGDEDSYSGYHNNYYKAGEKPPILAATDYEKGKVVFLGHDGFFANVDDDNNGKINLYEYDNKKLALNIINWLSSPTPQTIVGDWPMFKHDAARTGATEEVVEPPLELLWEYETHSSVLSSPTVSGGVVYVGSGDYHIYAIDASTGNMKWKYKTVSNIYSSPAVYKGVVYVGGSWDNYLYALDASTGSLKWKYKTDGSIGSSPAVSGDVVYIGSDDNYVYALDAATGEVKWKYKTGHLVRSSPAVSGGVVYVGSLDTYIYALDADTGSLKWKYRTDDDIGSSPTVSGGVVYVGSGDYHIYAIDARTGNMKWKYRTDGKVVSSPAVSGGVVYVGSWDTYVYALDASTGSLKWKYRTGSPVESSPAVSGGVVYVGSLDTYIYAQDASTGSLKWKYKTDGQVVSSPAVSDGVLYMGSNDAYVYAFASASNSGGSTLSNGKVSPKYGLTADKHTFSVTYKNPNGYEPIDAYVRVMGFDKTHKIYDKELKMRKQSGDIRSGAIYSYTAQFSEAGEYFYYFYFNDGREKIYLPSNGFSSPNLYDDYQFVVSELIIDKEKQNLYIGDKIFSAEISGTNTFFSYSSQNLPSVEIRNADYFDMLDALFQLDVGKFFGDPQIVIAVDEYVGTDLKENRITVETINYFNPCPGCTKTYSALPPTFFPPVEVEVYDLQNNPVRDVSIWVGQGSENDCNNMTSEFIQGQILEELLKKGIIVIEKGAEVGENYYKVITAPIILRDVRALYLSCTGNWIYMGKTNGKGVMVTNLPDRLSAKIKATKNGWSSDEEDIIVDAISGANKMKLQIPSILVTVDGEEEGFFSKLYTSFLDLISKVIPSKKQTFLKELEEKTKEVK